MYCILYKHFDGGQGSAVRSNLANQIYAARHFRDNFQSMKFNKCRGLLGIR